MLVLIPNESRSAFHRDSGRVVSLPLHFAFARHKWSLVNYCIWPKVAVQTAPTFSRIRVNALNLPISVLSSDRNQSKGTPGYLRGLATALVYNPIMKIESLTTPKYRDLSQLGDGNLVVLPENAPWL